MRDELIIVGVVALGAYYLVKTSKPAAASPGVPGVNPLGDLFNTGITAGAKGTATDPGGTLVGSGIPMGPSGPPQTNPPNDGDYGPKLPDGSMSPPDSDLVGKGNGQTPPIVDHFPPIAVQ